MPKVCAMGTANGFLMPSGDFPEMRKGIEDDIDKAEQGYDITKPDDTQVTDKVKRKPPSKV